MVAPHVHAKATDFISRRSTGGQFNLRSARDLLSQISHSCECGAARFLVWWLFLHRRVTTPATRLNLRRAASPPSAGPLPKGTTRFYSSGSRKPSRLSLAEPFGSDPRRHRISSRLPVLSPSASPHRLPIPLSVSKAVTFVTRALYVMPCLRSIFWVFYFSVRREIVFYRVFVYKSATPATKIKLFSNSERLAVELFEKI